MPPLLTATDREVYRLQREIERHRRWLHDEAGDRRAVAFHRARIVECRTISRSWRIDCERIRVTRRGLTLQEIAERTGVSRIEVFRHLSKPDSPWRTIL